MRGILFSVALHTLVVLTVALGLPWLTKPPANASRSFTVDIVRLSDITQTGKGEKPKPKTAREPDAERETTEKPVARDRSAEQRPVDPKPVEPKPAAPEPPKAAEAKPAAPAPPRTAVEKPKPAAPAKTVTAERKTAPPARPKPVEKAAPAPKPRSKTPQRVDIDPRALERQAEKPKKKLPAKKPETQMAKAVPKPEKKKVPPKKPEAPVAKPKKPEPPITKPTPKPVAKPKKTPEKKLETRAAGPAPKPEKKQAAPKKAAKPEKPEKMVAKPKKKPERKPPETAKNAAPKIERQVAALPRMRPPAKPRPKTAAKKPRKTLKKRPAKEDPLDSVFKTVGKLKRKAEQSDRDRRSARTTAGVKTSARSRPMTLSEIEAVRRQIRRQIQPCWNFPAGAQDAGSLRVMIRIWLNRDGSVRGEPKVLDEARFTGDRRFRAAAEAGLRAVKNPKCSPLKLPTDKYDQWKVLTIDFDPTKLSTG